jgi:hypothetical protein
MSAAHELNLLPHVAEMYKVLIEPSKVKYEILRQNLINSYGYDFFWDVQHRAFERISGKNKGMYVQVGVIHRHYKGGRYVPLGVVRNSEKREQLLVIYMSLDRGTTWARPLNTEGEDSWMDNVAWPDKCWRPRFTPEVSLSSHTLEELEKLWADMKKEK